MTIQENGIVTDIRNTGPQENWVGSVVTENISIAQHGSKGYHVAGNLKPIEGDETFWKWGIVKDDKLIAMTNGNGAYWDMLKMARILNGIDEA